MSSSSISVGIMNDRQDVLKDSPFALPVDILVHIMEELEPIDILRLRKVGQSRCKLSTRTESPLDLPSLPLCLHYTQCMD